MADRIREIEAEQEVEKPYDASDSKQVNNARKKAARKMSDRLRMVEGIMTLKEGRKWLFDFMQSCDMFGNALVQGDAYGTHFRLGQQDAAKRILLDCIAASPELYVQMMKEGNE